MQGLPFALADIPAGGYYDETMIYKLVIIPTYDESANVDPISHAIFAALPETDILSTFFKIRCLFSFLRF